MPKTLLHIFTFSLLFISLLASNYKINPSTRFYVDQYNRSLLFHGVNVVYKLPPYYPILDTYDPINSLCEQDFQNLRQWGHNSMRLYMSWEGTEQVRGQYNQTYMSIIQNITRTAAKYNVSVILDAHQDIVSRKFCGEGFPDWAVNRSTFPAPSTVNISFDAQGHANLTDCLQISGHDLIRTDDVKAAFDSFYKNVDGIADSFANFWQAVAAFFKDEPNILGYELLNEPNPGSLTFLDRDYLTPLYKNVHDKIRAVDNETIIIFEPCIWDASFAGFTEGPGGPEYNDRQVLAYHIYCSAAKPDMCAVENEALMLVKAGSANKLNLAGFMTEFGAVDNSEDSAEKLTSVTELADQYLHSWSYWMYKSYQDFTGDRPPSMESFFDDDGTLQEVKVKALSRSYAYATCGVPTEQKFERSTGNFKLTYKAGNGCQGERTEIFLNQEFYYPNGFSVKFDNCDKCELVQISESEANYYAVELPDGIAEGTVITVTVTPTSSLEKFNEDLIEFMDIIS